MCDTWLMSVGFIEEDLPLKASTLPGALVSTDGSGDGKLKICATLGHTFIRYSRFSHFMGPAGWCLS